MKTKLFLPFIIAISMGLFFACDTTDSDDTDDGNGGGGSEVSTLSGTLGNWDGSTDKTIKVVVEDENDNKMTIATATIDANGAFELSNFATPTAAYLEVLDPTEDLDPTCTAEVTISDETAKIANAKLVIFEGTNEIGGAYLGSVSYDSTMEVNDYFIEMLYLDKAVTGSGYTECDYSSGNYQNVQRQEMNVSFSAGWNKMAMVLKSKGPNASQTMEMTTTVPSTPAMKVFWYSYSGPKPQAPKSPF